jgi:hypothetical protein
MWDRSSVISKDVSCDFCRSVGYMSFIALKALVVRSPAGAKDFSSNLCDQTGSEAHPASCTMGTGGPFPGSKRGLGVTLTTHRYLVLRSKWVGAIPPLPPSATMACSGTALLLQALVTALFSDLENCKEYSVLNENCPEYWAQNNVISVLVRLWFLLTHILIKIITTA